MVRLKASLGLTPASVRLANMDISQMGLSTDNLLLCPSLLQAHPVPFSFRRCVCPKLLEIEHFPVCNLFQCCSKGCWNARDFQSILINIKI